jgi:hypothetical protein
MWSDMKSPMNSQPLFLPDSTGERRPSAQEIMSDHRARVHREADERALKRQLQLNEQRSSTNPPAERIRAWEKAHGLRLPSTPTHPVLEVIARDTGLSLEEVRNEQQIRRAR